VYGCQEKTKPAKEKSQSGTETIERFQEQDSVKSISSNDQQERNTRLYSSICSGLVPSLRNPEKREFFTWHQNKPPVLLP